MDLNILSVIIVATAAPTSGLVLAYLTGKERRREKAMDWERQDLVAERAKKAADDAVAAAHLVAEQAKKAADDAVEAANLVALQAAEAAKLLLAENKKVAVTAIGITGQLREIHTLVNSNMTASIQAQLDTTILLRTSINEVLCLQKIAGHEPAEETLASLETAQAKIVKLTTTLAERAEADRLVEEQKAATKAAVAEL